MNLINFLSIIFFSIVSVQNSLNSLPYKLDYLTNGEQKVCLIHDVHDVDKNYLGINYLDGVYMAAYTDFTGKETYYKVCDQLEMDNVLKQKKASIFDKQLILESEKALIEKFNELDKNAKAKIDVIWEISEKDKFENGSDIFIGWMPNYLSKKCKNLNIIGSDNFRRLNFEKFENNLFHYALNIRMGFDPYNENKKEKILIYKDFRNIFEKIVFELIPAKINKFDINIQKNLLEQFLNFHDKYLKPYKNLNDDELFIEIKKLEKDEKYIENIAKVISRGMADIEMIISILNSNNCILYAGSSHCYNISEFLVKKLNYNLISQTSKECNYWPNIVRYYSLLVKLFGKYLHSKLMYKLTKNLYYLTEQNNNFIKSIKPVEPQAFNILDKLIS